MWIQAFYLFLFLRTCWKARLIKIKHRLTVTSAVISGIFLLCFKDIIHPNKIILSFSWPSCLFTHMTSTKELQYCMYSRMSKLLFSVQLKWMVTTAGVVSNSDPLTDYYPPSIGRFRVRCGGGVRIRGGVKIRQSDSDFKEGVIIWQGVKNGHNPDKQDFK